MGTDVLIRRDGIAACEMMRDMINRRIRKDMRFEYIVADSWFAPVENMRCIEKKGKSFIFEINDNRLRRQTNKREGRVILSG
jgi:hypothetical protein